MGCILLLYLMNCVFMLFLIVFVVVMLIWIILWLSLIDLIDVMFGWMVVGGGMIENFEVILQQLCESFGFDQLLIVQYFFYIVNSFNLDFGLFMVSFLILVFSMIGYVLLWILGLMFILLIIIFIIGNLFGVLIVWEYMFWLWKVVIFVVMVFILILLILLGLLLMYVFLIQFWWFLLLGFYGFNVELGWMIEFINLVFYYGFLLVMSIVVVIFGFWVLGMWGLMIIV